MSSDDEEKLRYIGENIRNQPVLIKLTTLQYFISFWFQKTYQMHLNLYLNVKTTSKTFNGKTSTAS